MCIRDRFIVDAIKCIVAQRLIRMICRHCREEYTPAQTARAVLGLTEEEVASATLARGKGCDACFHTGYSGRTGVFEVLSFTSELRNAVLRQDDLRAITAKSNLLTLDRATRAKVLRGETTVDEMLRLQTAFAT